MFQIEIQTLVPIIEQLKQNIPILFSCYVTFDNDHHTIHQQDSFCTMLMKIKPYAYCPIQI